VHVDPKADLTVPVGLDPATRTTALTYEGGGLGAVSAHAVPATSSRLQIGSATAPLSGDVEDVVEVDTAIVTGEVYRLEDLDLGV
jgi:hypothetical protein